LICLFTCIQWRSGKKTKNFYKWKSKLTRSLQKEVGKLMLVRRAKTDLMLMMKRILFTITNKLLKSLKSLKL
jgi:hypothetical protein